MRAVLVCVLAMMAGPVVAHDLGFAGLLSNKNKEDLPPLTLAAGEPIADAPLMLKSGMMYEIDIVADGSAELALEGSGFFRAIWINEIVINGLEIRPFGIESVEFDEEGTMGIEFLAIKPGRYELRQPGSTGDQKVDIIIQ